MKWESGSKYHLVSNPPGFMICRVYLGQARVLELWRVRDKACLARRWPKTHAESETALRELKELAT